MDWKQAISNYSNYLKIERGLSLNSIKSYLSDINKLVSYIELLVTPALPADISSDIIKDFIYNTAKVLSARSQSRLVSALKSFFDYLVFENYRQDNPVALIESPRIGRKIPITLLKQEVDQLLLSINLEHPQGQRNRAIVETLYSCGLRVSELINIKLSDLFFDEGFIKILSKGNKYRLVPVHSTTVKSINLYINKARSLDVVNNQGADILFLNRRGKRLTRQMVYIILNNSAKKINLKKKIGPHTLRHSFASYLLQNGADLRIIQQLLGHKSITTTEIYIHTDQEQLKQTVFQYHPRSKSELKNLNKIKKDSSLEDK
ncbi:MAG: site-specific tyrosine recombinase/integron integrase [Tenacibaculum sp.]